MRETRIVDGEVVTLPTPNSAPVSSSLGSAARPEPTPGETPLRYVAQEDPAGCGVACLAMVSGRKYFQVRDSLPPETLFYLTCAGNAGLTDHSIIWWLHRNGFWHRRSWMDGEGGRPVPTSGVALVLTHDAHWVVLVDGVVLDPARPTPLPHYDFRQAIEVLPPDRLASLTESYHAEGESRALAEARLEEVTAERDRLREAAGRVLDYWPIWYADRENDAAEFHLKAGILALAAAPSPRETPP